jgi:hypothetical protein
VVEKLRDHLDEPRLVVDVEDPDRPSRRVHAW